MRNSASDVSSKRERSEPPWISCVAGRRLFGSRDFAGTGHGSVVLSGARARGLKKTRRNCGEPRSFSPLFNVAASRPAQMTTERPSLSRQPGLRQHQTFGRALAFPEGQDNKPDTFRGADGDPASQLLVLASRARRSRRRRQGFRRALRPLWSAQDQGDGAPQADRDDQGARGVAIPAGEPRLAAVEGGVPGSRKLSARPDADREGTSFDAQSGADLAGRRRRGAGERDRLHRADCGASCPASEHFRRRQPEEFDWAARHFHPSHREPRRSVRRGSSRLSGGPLAGNLAAQLQRAGPRGVEAQSDPISQPKLAADGPAEVRADGRRAQAIPRA